MERQVQGHHSSGAPGDSVADSPLAGLRGLLIDLDGVVYTGGVPIPSAVAFLNQARQRGLPFLLATNNSTATTTQFAERLADMGIRVAPDEVLTSSEAAAAYVREQSAALGLAGRVLPVGEQGIHAALAALGLEVLAEPDAARAEWVVAGLDRAFDYARLTAATRAILAGARFVATNTDALLPVEGGQVLPGAGSMVAAIRGATGAEPVVVGKPEAALFQRGLQRLGAHSPREVAMVGDRIDTDIVGAQRAGLRTVLVLTGVSTAAAAAALDLPADVVAADLGEVARLLGWT